MTADTAPRPFQDRVILVTGAGQGIGRCAALTLAAQGATVILLGKSTRKLEAVYDEIEQAGHPQPALFPLDLAKADTAGFEGLAGAIAGQIGRLDGILHNAAWLESLCPLVDESLDRWLKTLRINLAAPFALTRACLPLLQAAPDASILMTSDDHGHVPAAYWGVYAISKAGVEALVRQWAQELEIHPQLRINAIIPGKIASPQRRRTHPGEKPGLRSGPEALMEEYLYWLGPQSRGRSGEITECAAGR